MSLLIGENPQPSLRERRKQLLFDARLYLCTDARSERGDLREFLHAAYSGGVDIIQLRDKKLEARAEIEALEVLREVAAEHGRLFAVNDRADVAALVGADVFHVGQGDLTTEQARQLLGEGVLLGRSNNSAAMFADSWADEGLDYAVIGPVWPTPTKPGRPAVGLDVVRECAGIAGVGDGTGAGVGDVGAGKVWWAIGGIDSENVGEVLDVGASRVVVVRAITEADDIEAAARKLRGKL